MVAMSAATMAQYAVNQANEVAALLKPLTSDQVTSGAAP
jgi:hypothetical protein